MENKQERKGKGRGKEGEGKGTVGSTFEAAKLKCQMIKGKEKEKESGGTGIRTSHVRGVKKTESGQKWYRGAPRSRRHTKKLTEKKRKQIVKKRVASSVGSSCLYCLCTSICQELSIVWIVRQTSLSTVKIVHL